ncbi:MAG: hypothetical protein V8T90_05110 [Victivallales bacterium]
MISCHCPKCKTTFRHADAEAVFCPHCKTVLCEAVERIDTTDETLPGERKRAGSTIGTWGCCGLIALAIFSVVMPFAWQFKPDPLAFITLGPLWCLFSLPVFRLYVKGYSWQIGLLSLLWWLFSFTIFWIIGFCVFGKVETLREWTLKSMLPCLLPGAIIAFIKGWSEHFFSNLQSGQYDGKE